MTNVLLFLILCVLLFGAGEVLTGLGWLAATVTCLLVAFLIVAVCVQVFRSVHRRLRWQETPLTGEGTYKP